MKLRQKQTFKNVILYIVLVIMAIASLFPIFFCVSSSLRTQEELFQNMFPFTLKSLIPTNVTFQNYVDIFRDYAFWRPIINTLIVTVMTIVLGCGINSLAAFAFTCFNFKGKKLIYPLVLVSFMVPFEAIAIPLYNVANSMHMVDTYAGMIVPAIADGLVTFLFIQFFKDIPGSLIEAARVDGAKWPAIFIKIIIPISIPVFITAGLMIFMNQWNSYLWPLLVARSKEIRTLQIAISQFTGERSVRWTYIYAGSVISAIIPIALFLPFQKYFVQGITAGSVKG
ncbi:carbohydrate ABC transporter permease [Lachnospiraceae bacterium 54-53]